MKKNTEMQPGKAGEIQLWTTEPQILLRFIWRTFQTHLRCEAKKNCIRMSLFWQKKKYRTSQYVIFTVERGFYHCSTSSVKTNAWKLEHNNACREHSMGFFSFLLATNAKHSARLELFNPDWPSPTTDCNKYLIINNINSIIRCFYMKSK